jgi:hypothetical protein
MILIFLLMIINPILVLIAIRDEVLFCIKYFDSELEYSEENLVLAVIAGISAIPILSNILFVIYSMIYYIKVLYLISNKLRKGDKKCGK